MKTNYSLWGVAALLALAAAFGLGYRLAQKRYEVIPFHVQTGPH